MSRAAIISLVERMMKDQNFANLLKENPEQAISDFSLSAEEAEAVRTMDTDGDGQFAELLDRRMVKTDGDTRADDNDGDGDDADDEWWIGSVTD